MNIMYTRREFDLSNFYQRAEAAGLFFRLAAAGCKGSVEYAWMVAELPYDWRPRLDGRTAEAKAFAKAEAAVIEALKEYDRARFAAHERAKQKP